jgi:hypothetical protein
VVKRIKCLHHAIGFHEDDAEESASLRRELALAHDIIEKLNASEVDRTSSTALIPASNQNAVDVNLNVTVILPPSSAMPRGPGEVEADFEQSMAPDGQAGDPPNVSASETDLQIIDAKPSSIAQQKGATARTGYDEGESGASAPTAGTTMGAVRGGDLVAPDPDLQRQFDAEKRRRIDAGEDHAYDAMTLWARHALKVDGDTARGLWNNRSHEFSRRAGRLKSKPSTRLENKQIGEDPNTR